MPDEEQEYVPAPGTWPAEPQIDVPISKDRIWVDGCFDFAHHGHAGALLQARRLGKELLVGIHSDAAILHNKGPTVMNLEERVSAVDACRWSTKSIPNAPYVTYLPWISHYGCYYVVHGDDITSDSGGEDCYRFVKAAGRFLVVKRTPGISTTDLVGRMLLCTKTHFIQSLSRVLVGAEGSGSPAERTSAGEDMMQRIKDYASDATGLEPGLPVFIYQGPKDGEDKSEELGIGAFSQIVAGNDPDIHQRVVYVDGGFDLFSSGHIEFLKQVAQIERGNTRRDTTAVPHGPRDDSPYIIVGVHDDSVINRFKGLNYPIMNIFERGLCVLQCRYVNCLIFSAPYTPSKAYLGNVPCGRPHVVYHGPTSFMPMDFDPYAEAKALGIYRAIGPHKYRHVNAGEIVQRIMRSRDLYEERQRKKGEKAFVEDASRERENAAREAAKN